MILTHTISLKPFITALFAVFCFTLSAQMPAGSPPTGSAPGGGAPAIGKVSGTVVDATTGLPVNYAVVSCIRTKDNGLVSGGYTDEKGYFLIESLPPGMFKLKITFLGFSEMLTDSFLITPKTPEKFFAKKLQLEPDAKQLKTVEVEAEKSMMQTGIDKKVYNVEKDLANTGGSAVDVMQNLPSVTVDQDRNISLRGANVNILIDGKPSNMTAAGALDQIPASAIDRIEVITNPSAKYDPDGVGGIINIILKKNDKPGLNGSVNATVGNGDKYNGGVNVNVRSKKINVAASYNYMNQRFNNTGQSITKNTLDTTFYIDQSSDGFQRSESHTGRIAVDWNMNKFNTLSAAFTPSWRQNKSPQLIKYLWYNEGGDTLDYFTRDNVSSSQSWNYDASVNYARTFRKPGIDYSADFYISYSAPTDSLDAMQDYYDVNQPWMNQRTQNMSKNLIVTGQTDYSQKIGDSYKIEAGLKTIQRQMDYDFYSKRAFEDANVFVPDGNLNNAFTYSDQVYSAYATFTGSVKKFGYSAGLRAEQTFYTVDQKTLNQKFERQYFSLFPSAFVKYKVNEGVELGLSYSRRINRPRGWDLNPFPDYSDPYSLFVGNPYLKPEYVNSIDLSATVLTKKFTIAPSVYYRYTTGVFTRFRTVDTLGVSRITSYNLNTSHSGGIDLTVRYDATKWWRINVNGGIFYTKLNGSNLQEGLSAGRYGGMGRGMMSFKPVKGLDIQLAYNIGVPWVFTQGYIKPFQSMDISAKYDFGNDRFSLTAKLSDVFDQRRFAYVTEGAGFAQDGYRKRESRFVNLSLTWKFGKALPQSKRSKAAPTEMQDNGGGGGI